MNENSMSKILAISTQALGPDLATEKRPATWDSRLKKELFELLSKRNGFFSFDSALLIRPLGANSIVLGVEKWNERSLWLDTYKLELPELFFFAEDLFGGQFAIMGEVIVTFDPETGELDEIADSFDGWATRLIEDYDFLTGHSLALEWKRRNGEVPHGVRLIPKQLFVLGGEFECDNLMLVGDVRGMRSRGFFATALVDVPDGEQVFFELVD